MISALSLGFVLYLANPRQLVKAIQMGDLRVLALGLALSLCWLVVRTAVWRTLLQEQAGFRLTFLTINEGYLLNNVLPFRLGEVGRAFLLSQKAGLGFWQVLSTILVERILDVAFAVGLLGTTLAFVAGAQWARQGAIAAGFIVAVGLGALYLLARNQGLMLNWLEKWGQRWPIIQKITAERLSTFFSGLAALKQGRLFLRTVLLMLLNWGVAILQYYFLLKAFVPQATLLWAAFCLGVGALGVAAPSSPGAVGVMELSLVGALAVFGVDPALALAFALSAHMMNYLMTGIIGAYALFLDGESLTSLYSRIRHFQQKPAS